MEREEYLKYRKSYNILPVAYNYMIEVLRESINYEDFAKLFPAYIAMTKANVSYIWKHYDIKFQVYILENIKTKQELLIF